MEQCNLPCIRCHKCRHDLKVPDAAVTGAHGPDEWEDDATGDTVDDDSSLIFLSEDRLPGWIRAKVEEEGWLRGKLHCENCGGKVGSFDFVSGRKCGCGQHILPAVHLIRSQVDVPVNITRDLSSNTTSDAVP